MNGEVKIMRWPVCLFLGVISLVLSSSLVAQDRYIELQVVSRAGGELGVEHELMQMLSEVGADRVSTKSTTGNARTDVIETETRGSTHVLIVGILDGRTLKLPGGRYSLRDADRIKEYIQKMRDDGAEIALGEKQAFGLTSPQLVEVFDSLSGTVLAETKGQPSDRIIQELVTGLRFELSITPQARRQIDATPIFEEYQGLSAGTALAGILRPLGLVLSPFREQGKKVQFRIAASSEVDEHWPVGWPIEEAPVRAEPKLFERLDNVDIQNFSLQDTFDAIQQRVGVPFLYDQNGIARAGVELDKVNVTLVRDRMKYMLVLEKVASQSKPKMSVEIRKDENGKSFVWVSPR